MESKEQRLSRLIMTYEKDVLRMCCVYLRDKQLAEDAAQETFLKAYKGLASFQEACSEKTWLMRIAVNTCKDIRRSAWLRFVDRRISIDRLPEPVSVPSDEHLALTMAIMRLPRRELEVVMLHYYQDMDGREIAGVLGISPSAVAQRLKKGRKLLREALKGGEQDA